MSKKNRNKNRNNVSVPASAVVAEEVATVEAVAEEAVVENTPEAVAEALAEEIAAEVAAEEPVAEEAETAEEPVAEETEPVEEIAEEAEPAEELEEETEPAEEIAEEVEPAEEPAEAEIPEEIKLAREAAALATKNRKERSEENAKAREIDEKREARRKRRIKNQIISYSAVVLIFAVVIAGGFFGIRKLVDLIGSKKTQTQVAQTSPETEEKISDLIGQEEEIKEPEIKEDQIIETPVEEPVEVDPLDEYIDGVIASMTLEQKVAGLFLTSPEALTGVDVATVAGDGTRKAIEQYAVGGILYDAKNVSTKDQFEKMVNGTVEMLGTRPVFIAFAEEGGAKNSALAKAGFYEAQDSAKDVAATNDVSNAYNAGQAIGTALNGMGINLVLAPVTDLTAQGSVLGDRTYGDTAVLSSGYVNHMMQGLDDSGVTSCLKYFPGYGNVSTDPKSARAVTDRAETDFRANEFLIYEAAIQSGAKMIMMSDVVVTAFDDSCPATLSSTLVTDILRGELEYDGIVLSANLSDAAVSEYYEPGEASVLALKAGCDMLQNPTDLPAAYNAVIEAVNSNVVAEQRINDSLKRIYRILYADKI